MELDEKELRESMYDTAKESFEYCVPVIMNGKRKDSLIAVMIEDESHIVKTIIDQEPELPLREKLQSVEREIHNRVVEANFIGLTSNIVERVLIEEIHELCELGKWQEAFNTLKTTKKYYEESVLNSDFITEDKIKCYYKVLNMLGQISEILTNDNNKTL